MISDKPKENSKDKAYDLTKSQMDCKIIFVSGPMFAGKSKLILDLAEKFESVEAYKPAVHTRDGNFIRSRAGKEIPCYLVGDIRESMQSHAQLTVIDESQFIDVKALKDVLEYFKRQRKTLIIAGLRKKDRFEYWENYRLLKEKSDILIKLQARCEVCGKPAKYTYTNKEGTPRAIARRAKFGTAREPRCGECYGLII